MVGAVLGGVRVDGHAADRIDSPAGRHVVMMVMLYGHGGALPLIPLGGI